MFTYSKMVRCGAVLCSVLSVAFAASAPVGSAPASSKAPGMLISPKRGWRLGFVSATPGLLKAPAAAISTRKLKATTSLKMGLSGSNLVTYGDVWRDAIEGQNAEKEAMADTLAGVGMQEAEEDIKIVDVVRPFTMAASAFGHAAADKAMKFWNSLIDEPTPEEVQANLAAFARAHSGAVATPLSDDELETEVKYCAMIPELRDALVDAEVMQQELNDAILHRKLAAKIKSLGDREPAV